MLDEDVREDIAFIRAAIEEGRGYAVACGPDMAVWGVTLAIGFAATYAFVRGWSPLPPLPLWLIVLGLPWAYRLFRAGRRALAGEPARRSPTVMSLRMLWLGLGIFLTTLAVAALWTGESRNGWLDATAAGAMGMAVFATAWLAALPWLRWVAFAWWCGELALFALRHRPEALLLSAALMLVLLAGPGLVLAARRRRNVLAA